MVGELVISATLIANSTTNVSTVFEFEVFNVMIV